MAFSDFTREQRAEWACALWVEPAARAKMIKGMREAWLHRETRIVVTDAMLATIHECNDGRIGQRETAKRIGIGRQSFLRILKEHGVAWKRPARGSYRTVYATPEILAAIHDALSRGLSLTVASERIGIGRNTLRKMLREHGIVWRKPGVANRISVTPKLLSDIRKGYDRGFSQVRVAAMVGISTNTLARILREQDMQWLSPTKRSRL